MNLSGRTHVGRTWWPLADIAVVLVFVLVGRENHGEGNAFFDVVRTAAPFVVGLVAGWFVTGARLAPLTVRTGTGVAAVTVVVGLVVRRIAFGDGIAAPFVIVTTGVLLAGLVGWRVVAHAWRRRQL